MEGLEKDEDVDAEVEGRLRLEDQLLYRLLLALGTGGGLRGILAGELRHVAGVAQHLVAAAAGGGARRAHDLGAEEARRLAVVQRAPHLGDQVAGQLRAQLQQRHLAHQQVRH